MQKTRRGICLVITFLFLLVCFVPSDLFSYKVVLAEEKTTTLTIHFIDVGQGDCIFLELADGKNMIIDGGRKEYSKWVVDYLNNLGVTKIDYMVATHSDEDHIGGLISVLEHFEVETIYRPFDICSFRLASGFLDELFIEFGDNYSSEFFVYNETYAIFLEKIYAEKCGGQFSTIKVCTDKEKLISSDEYNPYMIEFCMPKAKNVFTTSRIYQGYTIIQEEDKNATSAMILLTTEFNNFLFCGDATKEEERAFVESLSDYKLTQLENISLLKVGHHGAKTSTSDELIEALNPQNAVIMVGMDNDYGHPDKTTIDKLSKINAAIYRTDECGNIKVREVDGKLEFTASRAREKSFAWIIILLIGGTILVVVSISIIYPIIKKKRAGKLGTKKIR